MIPSEQQRQRRGPLRSLVKAITTFELVLGAVCLLAIFVLIFFQALQRYLPIDSIAWTGELASFSLIWLTFAASGVLITNRGHIALEIVDSIRSQLFVRVVQTFALLVVAAVAAGFTFEAFNLIQTQIILKSPVLRMPLSLVYIPVLIAFISTTIRALIAAVDIALHGPVFADVDEVETPEAKAV